MKKSMMKKWFAIIMCLCLLGNAAPGGLAYAAPLEVGNLPLEVGDPLLAVQPEPVANMPAGAKSGVVFDVVGDGYEFSTTTGHLVIKSNAGSNAWRNDSRIKSGIDFRQYETVKSVTITNAVTAINNYSFNECYKLISVTIANSVTTIGRNAFNNCHDLTSIVLPSGLKRIETETFLDCGSLNSVTFPSDLTSIGHSAFKNCGSLYSIALPDFLTSIEGSAFQNCGRLHLITFPVRPSEIVIGDYAFQGCGELIELALYNTSKSIGDSAFADCGNLREVIISESSPLESIGRNAFKGCSKLTQLTLPDKLASIGENAFANTGLSLLEFCGNAPTATGALGLAQKGVYYRKDTATGFDNAWLTSAGMSGWTLGGTGGYEYNSNNKTLTIKSNAGVINWKNDDEFFYKDVEKVVIEEGVTYIGEYAFSSCNVTTDVSLPQSLDYIGKYAFASCTELTRINLPSGLESISKGVFLGCGKLVTVGNASSVRYIEEEAFIDCSSLESFEFSSKVEYVGARAFQNCSSLDEITILSVNTVYGGNVFQDVPNAGVVTYINVTEATMNAHFPSFNQILGGNWTCKRLVDSGSYAYDASTRTLTIRTNTGTNGWRASPMVVDTSSGSDNFNVIDTVVLSENVTELNNYSFRYCTSLMSINLHNGITKIGDYAFEGCSNLPISELPPDITSIGTYAFYGCSKLIASKLPDAVTEIKAYAFQSCGGLTDITLPRSLTSIERYAFRHCGELTSVTFHDGVTTIGINAFRYCGKLRRLTFIGALPTIGSNAFNGVAYSGLLVYNPSRVNSTDPSYINLRDALPAGWAVDKLSFTGEGYIYDTSGNTLTVTANGGAANWRTDAFVDAGYITSVVVETGVTDVGTNAFAGCSNINRITFNAMAAPSMPAGTFTGVAVSGTIYYYNGATGYDAAWKSRIGLSDWETSEQSNIAGTGFNFNTTTKLLTITADAGVNEWRKSEYSISPEDILSIRFYSVVALIPEGAFEGCTNLETLIYISSSHIASIGDRAFKGCSSLAEITFPSALRSIGASAFESCSSLAGITFPNALSSIGASAFKGCSSLAGITFPNALSSISESAFEGCWSLAEVTLPNALSSISASAFKGCSSLTEITFPGALRSIDASAFEGCSLLSNLKFLAVTALADEQIGEDAFANVDATGKVMFPGNSTGYNADFLTALGLGDDWELLEVVSNVDYQFDWWESKLTILTNEGCTSWKNDGAFGEDDVLSVEILPGVTQVSAESFSQCRKLASVELPDTLERIENAAFRDCEALESIELPSSIEYIGLRAFVSSGLREITFLSSSPPAIGDEAFLGIPSTGTIYRPAVSRGYTEAWVILSGLNGWTIANESGEGYAFDLDTGVLTVSTDAGTSAWRNDARIARVGLVRELVVEAGVANVAANAFKDCSNLNKITFAQLYPPHIGSNAFAGVASRGTLAHDPIATGYDATWLGTVGLSGWTPKAEGTIIGDGYTYDTVKKTLAVTTNDGTAAWRSDTYNIPKGEILAVTLSDDVREIADDAFMDLTAITAVTFPADLTTIRARAFEGCSALAKLHFTGATAPTTVSQDAFLHVASTGEVLFPENAASYNANFITSLGLGSGWTSGGVVSGEGYHFNPNSGHLTITANKGCHKWRSDGISPENVLSLEVVSGVNTLLDESFMGCTNLVSAKLPDLINTIGLNAFRDCSRLSLTSLPDSLTSIDSDAFKGCGSLRLSSLPGGLTSIGSGAFEECSALALSSLPSGLNRIGERAFRACYALKITSLPGSLKSIAQSAFSECVGITSLEFPENFAAAIEQLAFNGCSKLSLISFKSPVPPAEIDSNAFSGIASNGTIFCPDNSRDDYEDWLSTMAVISNWSFAPARGYQFESSKGKLTITSNAGTSAWRDDEAIVKSQVLSVEVIHGVTQLNSESFKDCASLINVVLPETLKRVNSEAFSGCSALKDIILPKSIKHIGDSAFNNCSSFRSITIPSISPPEMGANVFSGASQNGIIYRRLRSSGFDEAWLNANGIPGWGFQYYKSSNDGWVYYIADNILEILSNAGSLAWRNWSGFVEQGFSIVEAAIINENVSAISDGAFTGCNNLDEITFQHNAAPSIRENAFDGVAQTGKLIYPAEATEYTLAWLNGVGLSNWTVVAGGVLTGNGFTYDFDQKVLTITTNAGTTSWRSDDYAIPRGRIITVTLSPGVTSIADEAFKDCSSITAVTFPEGLTFIGAGAFSNCSNLEAIEFLSQTAPDVVKGAFSGVCDTGIVKFPKGAAGYDNDFETALDLPSGWTFGQPPITTADYVFYPSTGRLLVKTNAGTSSWLYDTQIGTGYATRRNAIKSVAIETNVTSINSNAFYLCENLKSITIPESVASIGTDAFYGSGLESITLPVGVTAISNYTFQSCKSLASVSMPGVTSIGTAAFSGCEKLAALTFMSATAPSIGQRSFSEVPENGVIYRPSIYVGYTDEWKRGTGIEGWTFASTSSEGYTFDLGTGVLTVMTDSGTTAWRSNANIATDPTGRLNAVRQLVIEESVTNVAAGAFENCANLNHITFRPPSPPVVVSRAFSGVAGTGTLVYPPVTAYSNNWFSGIGLSNWTVQPGGVLTGDGFTYDADQKALTITSDTGITAWQSDEYNISADEILTINLSEGVTSIADNAFKDCSSITAIIFPASLTSIGAGAFSNCSRLAFIEFLSQTPLTSANIDPSAFANISATGFVAFPKDAIGYDISFLAVLRLSTPGWEIGQPLITTTDYVFNPNTFHLLVKTNAGTYSWRGDTQIDADETTRYNAIKSVTMETNVTSIDSNAFWKCANLASVIMPSVTSIGGSAFYNCASLEGITLPVGVTAISDSTFRNCKSLASVSMPGVTSIGNYVFYGCESLKSITIPESVESIGTYAFYGTGLEGITLPDRVTAISDSTFYNCKSLVSATLPGVTSIGTAAFRGCEKLAALTFMSSTAPSIGQRSFNDVPANGVIYRPSTAGGYTDEWKSGTGIVNWTIENSPGSGEGYSFNLATGALTVSTNAGTLAWRSDASITDLTLVTALVIEEGVTSVEAGAFEGCSNLSHITFLPSSPPVVGERAFSGVAGTGTLVYLPMTAYSNDWFNGIGLSNWTVQPGGVLTGDGFTYDADPKALTITSDDGITAWQSGDYAIPKDGILTINLSEGVTSVADEAFKGCSAITAVTFPASLTSIGAGAFSGCSHLEAIEFLSQTAPDVVKGAFANISATGKVAFPKGATSYDETFFAALNLPSSWTFGLPPITGEGYSFNLNNGKLTITTSLGSDGWRTNSAIVKNDVLSVEVADGVDAINYNSFYNCRYLKTVSLPSTLVSIGNDAFDQCRALESINLPDTLERIGNNLFRGCASLASISLPSKLNSIGAYAFYGCGIQSIELPVGVTATSNNTFQNCASLTSVTILGVTSIGDRAFSGCSSLAELTFMTASAPTIGTNAFNNVPTTGVIRYLASAADSFTGTWRNGSGISNWTLESFEFVAVTGIVGVPTEAVTGVELPLTGTVEPSNSTSKTIVWSVSANDAGTTNAIVTGDKFMATAVGTATVTATIANGTAVGTPYTQDFTITVTNPFVAVTGIVGVPTEAATGVELELTGTVEPSNATSKTIVWSVSANDAGTTNAIVTGDKFMATAAGTATVTATIADGTAVGTPYTQDFTITVTNPFVAVTGIVGVPTEAATGVELTLTGTVEPSNSTSKTIVWSVSANDAGTTNANVTGDKFMATAVGTATVTATIADGTAVGTPYTQDFNITVSPTTYTVTVINGTGGGDFAEGETVTITADIPESGKQFKEWAISSSVIFTEGSALTATAKFTMPAEPVTATATYENIPSPPTDPVVIIGDDGKPMPYASLQEALESVEKGQTIILYGSQTIYGNLRVPDEVTLDTGGNLLTCDKLIIGEGASVIIPEGQELVIGKGGSIAELEVYGTLIVNGNVVFDGVTIEGDGYVVIESGSITLRGICVIGNIVFMAEQPATTKAKSLNISPIIVDASFRVSGVTGTLFLPAQCYKIGFRVMTIMPGADTPNFKLAGAPDDAWYIDNDGCLAHDESEPGDIIPEYLIIGKNTKVNVVNLLPWKYEGAVTWESGDEKILKVVKNGKKRFIKGIELGETTLKATFEDGDVQIIPLNVVVKKEAVSSVGGPNAIKLKRGETRQLTPKVKPAKAIDKTLFWLSSDEKIATVENGLITAVETGVCRVVAVSTSGKRKIIKVTVTKKTMPTTQKRIVEDVVIS